MFLLQKIKKLLSPTGIASLSLGTAHLHVVYLQKNNGGPSSSMLWNANGRKSVLNDTTKVQATLEILLSSTPQNGVMSVKY